jgi:hypothetical protein
VRGSGPRRRITAGAARIAYAVAARAHQSPASAGCLIRRDSVIGSPASVGT